MSRRSTGLVVGVLICLLAGTATSQQRAPAFSGNALVAAPRAGWPTNGGNWYNQRWSPLGQIDRTNVASLKGVWQISLNGSGIGPQFSAEAQPIVHDGVIYVSTGANDVFAVRVDDGAVLWTYEADLDPDITTVCCGWANRGVALGEGRIFQGQLDGRLVALDQASGAVVWSVQAERWEDGFTLTSAPLYYDGLVITGFAGAELGVRGRVKAYSASDGSLVWTFYTVPGPGDFGHDTWPADNEIWMHGGGTVWQTPALDPELSLLYFSTGNAGPDFNGAIRAGDNLFTSSIVAVDVRTGEYRWHFQQVHHDLWDYDSPNPVVLFDIELDGRARRGLAQASKTGWVYLLDRTNGEPLLGIDERPVPQEPRQATAATQPFPRGDAFVPQALDIAPEGFELVNSGAIFTPYWTDYVIAKPGISGGANWPPSAYDPTSGRFFVCASDGSTVFRAWEIDAERPPAGGLYIGGDFGRDPMPRHGIVAAIDVTTNRLVWQQRWPERCFSGATATAGGLVFVGRNDGRLTALDADNGRQLWAFQTGAGMNSTVSVFEHAGREYVVALAGGNASVGSTRGDRLWLFGLDGELDPVAPGGGVPASLPAASGGDPVAGADVYQSSCTFCHGPDGTGGHDGPAFGDFGSVDEIRRIVTAGRNAMPAFGPALGATQIGDVSAHVLELIRSRDSD